MEEEDQKKLSDVTVVTCYYQIPSKQSKEVYHKWIANFMQMNFQVVIFTDQETYEFLNVQYPARKNRIYQVVELKEFVCSQEFCNDGWDFGYHLDHELYTVRHSVPLYKVWNEKLFFVRRAVTLDPYHSDYFLWADIGCFREANPEKRFPYFPSSSRLSRNKITMLSIEPMLEEERKMPFELDNRFQKLARIGGGIFGGGKDACLQFVDIHHRMLLAFKQRGLFAGKDQNLYIFAIIQYPDLFDIVTRASDGDNYDPWMYLHIYLNRIDTALSSNRLSIS